MPAERDGIVAAESVATAIDDRTALVTIIHAQNEIGTLQPVAEIARAAKARGALVHTDAAQSVGKIPVDVHELGVDLLTIAGHKLYAPKGIGALFIRRGLSLPPVIVGAGQEHGVRPGTENVAFIVGLGAACRVAGAAAGALAPRPWPNARPPCFPLLQKEIPGLTLVGDPMQRLPEYAQRAVPRRLRTARPGGLQRRSRLHRLGLSCRQRGAICYPDRARHSKERGAGCRSPVARPRDDRGRHQDRRIRSGARLAQRPLGAGSNQGSMRNRHERPQG